MWNENICLELPNVDIRKLTEKEKKYRKTFNGNWSLSFPKKKFWSGLNYYVTQAVDISYEIGKLPPTNKFGIITCIPEQCPLHKI